MEYALGDVNYRLTSVYDKLQWTKPYLKLDDSNDSMVVAAPNAGPIAITQCIKSNKQSSIDSNDFDPTTTNNNNNNNNNNREIIKICTGAGTTLSIINIPNKRVVCGMGWTSLEHLMVVYDVGKVVVYELNGKL